MDFDGGAGAVQPDDDAGVNAAASHASVCSFVWESVKEGVELVKRRVCVCVCVSGVWKCDMALREVVTASTGVKVYAISGAKSVPAWERLASDSARRSLKKRDEDLQRHLELVQGLEFDAACTRLAPTRDGHYLLATGYHPPTVKCFDLDQLSLKWQRCLTSEIVCFAALDDDYSKLAFVCADRTLAFHAKFGAYFSTRTPRVGRALAYLPEIAELLVGGTGSEVYRLSLSEGRFMAPITTSGMDGVNAMDVSSVHGLLALGGEASSSSSSSSAGNGRMACYDPRTRNRVGTLGVDEDVTAVRFSPSGMQLACGTTAGIVKVFDLRSSTPLIEKDHMYDSKIVSVNFHSATAGALEDTKRSIVSSDKHAVRVWDVDTGSTTAAIEPPKSTINDICIWPGSGLVLVGCEHSKIQSYFIPSMGPAPRWCHFLEGLTEELEEQKNTAVYDDYRFVTKQELSALSLEHLIGTKLLRASMHGFFIDLRLYKRAKAIADPFAFETYRKQKIEAALKSQETTRIAVRKKLPKVNAELADRLRGQAEGRPSSRDAGPTRNQNDDDSEEEEAKEDTDAVGTKGSDDDGEDVEDLTPAERKKRKRDRSRAAEAASILDDDRFKAMFEDERFQVDTQSNEYKVLHPNADAGANTRAGSVDSDDDLLDEHFDEDDENGDDNNEEDAAEDEEDEADDWGLDAGVAFGPAPTRGKKRLLIEKDDAHTAAYSKGVSLAADLEKPLGERVEDEANEEHVETLKTKNIREMTFEIENPKNNNNKKKAGRRVEGLHRRSVSALRHK